MNDILLSICIPTYNRAEIVYSNIKKYLEFIGDNVQIVVSDNGSKDDTVKLLKSIEDKRLKVYKNTENKGVCYNVNKVIRVAKGDFVLIMSDEDIVDKLVFHEVLEVLKIDRVRENIGAFVFNSYFESGDTFSKEDEFMNLIYGRVSYISGIVFNKLKMNSNDFQVMDTLYPHMGYLLKMCCKGKIYFSKSNLIINGRESNFSDETLSIYNYNRPEQRLAQLEQDSKIILSLNNIDSNLKISLLQKMFYTKFAQGLLTYDLLLRQINSKEKIDTFLYIEKFKSEYKKILDYFSNIELQNFYYESFNYIKNYILNVKKEREKFDNLVNNNYKVAFVSINNSLEDIDNLLVYKFNIDYLYLQDKDIFYKMIYNIDYKKNILNKLKFNEIDLKCENKNILFVTTNRNKLLKDKISKVNIKNFEIIYIEDLRLNT